MKMNRRFAVVVVGDRVTYHRTWRRAREVFNNLVARHNQACRISRLEGQLEAWLDKERTVFAYVTIE